MARDFNNIVLLNDGGSGASRKWTKEEFLERSAELQRQHNGTSLPSNYNVYAQLAEGERQYKEYVSETGHYLPPHQTGAVVSGKGNAENKTDEVLNGEPADGEPADGEPAEPTHSQAYQDYLNYMDAYNKGMSDYLSGEKFSDAETERDKYYKLAQDYMDKYINRDSFSYDVNTDKMYAMYRDQYLNQAQQAQKDAMAQAAALTGGYGSTYASAMGQRAYSAEMDKLDAKASELYDNAYARYLQEGQNMLDAASLYGSQAETLENRIANDRANMLNNAQLQYTLGQQKYQESDEYKQKVADEKFETEWKTAYDKGITELNDTNVKKQITNEIDVDSYKARIEAAQTDKEIETIAAELTSVLSGLTYKDREGNKGNLLSEDAIRAYIYNMFGLKI